MVFPGWQIGLDIQMEGVRAVAVQWHRQGWQLRHWWYLPVLAGVLADNLLPQPAALSGVLENWRKQLPRRHLLRVSFPAQRTLQREIPTPDEAIGEAVHEGYIAYITAQQLQMSASQLQCDYLEHDGVLNVTAARQSDINALLSCLKSVQLFPAAVTPCDKVLHTLPVGCYPECCHYLVHEEPEYWLWAAIQTAGISGWQDKRDCPDLAALCLRLDTAAEMIAFSSACEGAQRPLAVQELNIWQLLSRQYPPFPPQKGLYTIAMGLALGCSR